MSSESNQHKKDDSLVSEEIDSILYFSGIYDVFFDDSEEKDEDSVQNDQEKNSKENRNYLDEESIDEDEISILDDTYYTEDDDSQEFEDDTDENDDYTETKIFEAESSEEIYEWFDIPIYIIQEEKEEKFTYTRSDDEKISLFRSNQKNILSFCRKFEITEVYDILLEMFLDSNNISASLRYIELLFAETDISHQDFLLLAEVRIRIAFESERLLPWDFLYFLLENCEGIPSIEEFYTCLIDAVNKQKHRKYVTNSLLIQDFIHNINYTCSLEF